MTTQTIIRPGGNLPLTYMIGHLGTDSVGQGSWVLNYGGGGTTKWAYNFYNTTHNNGDNFTQSVWLPSGTYTLNIDYQKFTNRGIIEVYVDDVLKGSVDSYNSTAVYDATLTITGIALGRGKHNIKFAVNGKNAASTSYYIYLGAASWTRTSFAGGADVQPVESFDCVSPITVIPFYTHTTTVVQGTITSAPLSTWPYGIRPTNGAANNGDGESFNQVFCPGTWTAILQTQIQANGGLVDLSIDGAVKGTFDLYNATTNYITPRSITGIVLPGDRISPVSLVTNGKNASSGGYVAEWQALLFKRTA